MANYKVQTPKKAKVQGAIKYLQKINPTHPKQQVFNHFQVSRRTSYHILQDHPQQFHHNPFINKTRSQRSLITNSNLHILNKFI
ncbi:hypothetical protein LY78DRAFT_579860 [Colletotrichum sublineola]|nr:hypothetical protein LY78DRAFT_579860 [Colletotrichum sublineola]